MTIVWILCCVFVYVLQIDHINLVTQTKLASEYILIADEAPDSWSISCMFITRAVEKR